MCVCVCVCVFVCVWLFWDNWNYFSLPLFTFPVKRQRKDVTSIRSCNSVHSTWLYNLEIMIKMSIIITIVVTAVMILASSSFQISFLICKKQCHSLSRKHKFQKRSTKTFTFCRKKIRCQKCKVSILTFAKFKPANFSVLISTKFINLNLSKSNNEIL